MAIRKCPATQDIDIADSLIIIAQWWANVLVSVFRKGITLGGISNHFKINLKIKEGREKGCHYLIYFWSGYGQGNRE